MRLHRVPVINAQGPAGAHQEVHAVAASLWGEDERLRRERVHALLLDRVEADPDGLGTYEEAGRALAEKLGLSEADYGRLLAREGLEEELLEARRKGKIMRQVLGEGRRFREPVFIVENRYVLATDGIQKTMQTLNWVIARLKAGE